MRALRELRDSAVDDAAAVLRAAESALTEAERAHAEAERAFAQSDRRLKEAPRPVGTLSASDLQHFDAYRDRLRAEREDAKEAVDTRQEAVRKALDERERTRGALARARAEAKAIERHEAEWRAGLRRKAAKREEDEADDRPR